ncbi:MAG: ribosome-associated translation inhibitor RaiA [Ruminococcaceae bacterium]|nr:ribosome-associated translation inhibitor RaiA [Oscillospiraceae bacterium]
MRMNITAKKMQISQAFNDYVEEKLAAKLDKFFTDDAECKITLTEQKNMITAEVTVKTANLIFRAEQKAAEKTDAFDAAIDRIIRQIRKNKTKVEKQLHNTIKESFDDVVEEQVDFEVVKHKKFLLKPMSVDEAILQMNMVGHSFFMFKNAENGEINVVYKRDDGNYAVLEPSEN